MTSEQPSPWSDPADDLHPSEGRGQRLALWAGLLAQHALLDMDVCEQASVCVLQICSC